MPLKRRDVEAALERKGFLRRERDHAYFIYQTEQGTLTDVRTKTSHGRRGADISDSLLSRMARQCHMSPPQFRDFVDCSLTRRHYEFVLVDADIIQPDELAEDAATEYRQRSIGRRRERYSP